jgi:hypothetical protein
MRVFIRQIVGALPTTFYFCFIARRYVFYKVPGVLYICPIFDNAHFKSEFQTP